MAAYKAKKLFTIGNQYYWESEFEYRGQRYTVEYSSRYTTFIKKPANVQHKEAQARIDKLLDNPANNEIKKYTGEAEKGFELFWEYVNA